MGGKTPIFIYDYLIETMLVCLAYDTNLKKIVKENPPFLSKRNMLK